MSDNILDRLPRRHDRPAVGDARLLREIGRGAMGVVFAAWHDGLNRPCAVKFLLHADRAGADRLARFRREARICAELDEPALVRVFESGETAGLHYLVMEWVPGRGLDRVTADAGRFTEAEALTVLRDVGQALIGLHRRGVVHRDIKPSNLLLRAADGRIKVADLGVAKQAGANDQIQTQTVLGTPAYMSPEQVQTPADVGPASDFFSLGGTAYTLLTGRVPFPGATSYETMRLICEAPLDHPAELGVAVSPATWRALQALTEKDPARRIATAEQLADVVPGISVPFRPEVLAAARPDIDVRSPDAAGTAEPPTLAAADSTTAATVAAATASFVAPARVREAILFCQCLQNDFLAPPPAGGSTDWAPPNKLHVGRDEARRLVGDDPRAGPLVRAVSACARAENVRLVHIRDWHDPADPRQRPELDFFGDHCLIGTWGARFIDAIEAFSRDRRRAAVVDAGGINDLHDTPILGMVEALARQGAWAGGADWRAAVPVGVIGVWTNVKVHYLLYDLKTRAGLHNLATCSALVASPDRAAHEFTLRHLAGVLGVKVFERTDEFLDFLGVAPAG